MQVSKHISFEEATRSEKAEELGIGNTPGPLQYEAMKLVAEKVFEPAREYMNEPLTVSSFFRSKSVNKLIGGAPTSQHLKGEAIDIKCSDNKKLFEFIKDNLDFDQLIYEFGSIYQPAWVHVSYSKNGNRKEVLRAKTVKGKTVYEKYN
jgi:hypothetical protein